MEIETKRYDKAALISFLGSLDALTVDRARQSLTGLLQSGQSNLILDLGQVSFMSSSGIRLIVDYLKQSREQGGDLRLAAAQPGVWRSLEISGLDRVLRAYRSIEKALGSFDAEDTSGDESLA